MQEPVSKKQLEQFAADILHFFKLKEKWEQELEDSEIEIDWLFPQAVKQFAEYLEKVFKKFEFTDDDIRNSHNDRFGRCFEENITLKSKENRIASPLIIKEAEVEKALKKYIARASVTFDSTDSANPSYKKWQKINRDMVEEKIKTSFRDIKGLTVEGYTAKTTDLDDANLEKFVQQAIALRNALLTDGLIKDEPVVINAPTPEALKKLEELCAHHGLNFVKAADKIAEAEEVGAERAKDPGSPKGVASGSDDEDDKGKTDVGDDKKSKSPSLKRTTYDDPD